MSGREVPPWVNLDALGPLSDTDYRETLGERGMVLAGALARWAKMVLPVSEWPSLGIDEGEARDAILDHLGFTEIEEAFSLIGELHALIESRDDPAPLAEFVARHPAPFEVDDHQGWFDIALGLAEAVDYAESIIKKNGGVVTWPGTDDK
jgi:hypothetical protein